MSFRALFWDMLLGLLLTGTSVKVEATEVMGTLGEPVTFTLDIPQSSNAVLWSRNETHVATLRRGPPCSLMLFDAYRGRSLTTSEDCSSVTVGDLHKEDAGKYTAQFQNQDTLQLYGRQTFTLKVYKRLAEADLEVVCKEESRKDGNKTLHINCSAGKWGDGVNFSWTSPGLEDKIPSSETSLFLLPNTQDDDKNVTCTATNPISTTSRTVSIKTCTAGKQPTRRPSTVADTETENTDSHSPPLPSIVVPVVVILILVVTFAVTLGWLKFKRNKAGRELIPSSNNSGPKDTKSLYAEIHNPQTSDAEPGSPRQGRGSGAHKETPTTIYVDVQHPEKIPLQTDDEKLRREKRRAAERSEKTIYSEISGGDMKEGNFKTIYDTVNHPKPPEAPEYNKIL